MPMGLLAERTRQVVWCGRCPSTGGYSARAR